MLSGASLFTSSTMGCPATACASALVGVTTPAAMVILIVAPASREPAGGGVAEDAAAEADSADEDDSVEGVGVDPHPPAARAITAAK